jgi:dsRNA-specific ribonuclease
MSKMTRLFSNISFKKFIESRLSCLPAKYVKILTDNESLKIYRQSFTSSEVDPINNYEYYEQMGDVTSNKFLVYYFYRRFPVLKCTAGVKVVARLKINYGSKKVFSELARKEGFWEWIRASEEEYSKRPMDLLEDTFEAFVGATESILDDRVEPGVGAVAAELFLKRIFDGVNVSLKYKDLYDSKTRLKELFDLFGDQLGKIKYSDCREYDVAGNQVTTSRVYRVVPHQKPILMAVGISKLKADAQRAAAENAIDLLNSQNFIKHPPVEYQRFQSAKPISNESVPSIYPRS